MLNNSLLIFSYCEFSSWCINSRWDLTNFATSTWWRALGPTIVLLNPLSFSWTCYRALGPTIVRLSGGHQCKLPVGGHEVAITLTHNLLVWTKPSSFVFIYIVGINPFLLRLVTEIIEELYFFNFSKECKSFFNFFIIFSTSVIRFQISNFRLESFYELWNMNS